MVQVHSSYTLLSYGSSRLKPPHFMRSGPLAFAQFVDSNLPVYDDMASVYSVVMKIVDVSSAEHAAVLPRLRVDAVAVVARVASFVETLVESSLP
jgi:hypothetical protein